MRDSYAYENHENQTVGDKSIDYKLICLWSTKNSRFQNSDFLLFCGMLQHVVLLKALSRAQREKRFESY